MSQMLFSGLCNLNAWKDMQYEHDIPMGFCTLAAPWVWAACAVLQ